MIKKTILSLVFTAAIFGLSSFFFVPAMAQVAVTSSTPSLSGSNDDDNVSMIPATVSPTIITVGSNDDEGSTTSSTIVSATPPATSTNADESSIIPSLSGSNGNNGDPAIPIIPTTQGSNGDEGIIVPVTQGSNGDETSSTTVTTATSTPTSTTTSPIVANDNGGVSSSVSSSGSFYGGNSYSSGGSVPLVALTSTSSAPEVHVLACPLISSYMRLGVDNDNQQVALLQAFLKNSQGIDVNVTGVFDQMTDTAVRAFQQRYLAGIMGPWGATLPSGYVYITTSKQINELACDTPFALSPSDIAIINAYKAGQNQNNPNIQLFPSAINASTTSATTTQLAPEVGQSTTTNTANTAAISNASALQSFWSFIKGIF